MGSTESVYWSVSVLNLLKGSGSANGSRRRGRQAIAIGSTRVFPNAGEIPGTVSVHATPGVAQRPLNPNHPKRQRVMIQHS